MTKFATIITVPALLALAACGSSEPETANSADDFAARINGGNDSQLPAATQTPTVVEPLQGAVQGPFQAGTATDPEAATCGATAMGPFLNLPADEPTRVRIQQAAFGVASEVRFIAPDGPNVTPDPTNPRLNIILDYTGVIRDARCG